MKRVYWMGAALAAMVVASPAAAQNAITNGSFESGFAGWTVTTAGGGTAPVVITYNNSNGYPTGAFGEPILTNTVTSFSPDAVGNNVAYFSSDTASPHALSQSVVLVGGITYNIGFDYYAPQNGINNPNDASLSFVINGLPVTGVTAGSVAGTPAQTWINFNTTFTPIANGAQTYSFEFRGLGSTAADFAIDRVYAVAAVPEPATWAMMLFGFGAVGGAVRRRKGAGRLALV